MSTVDAVEAGYAVHVKGAFEAVLACTISLSDETALTPAKREEVALVAAGLASRGATSARGRSWWSARLHWEC